MAKNSNSKRVAEPAKRTPDNSAARRKFFDDNTNGARAVQHALVSLGASAPPAATVAPPTSATYGNADALSNAIRNALATTGGFVKQEPYVDQYAADGDPNTEAQFLNWAKSTYGFARNQKEVDAGYTPFDDESYKSARKQFAYLKTNKRTDLQFSDHYFDPWSVDPDTNQARSDFITQNKRAPSEIEMSKAKSDYQNFTKRGNIDADTTDSNVQSVMSNSKLTADEKIAAFQQMMDGIDYRLERNPNDPQMKYDKEAVQAALDRYTKRRKSANDAYNATQNSIIPDITSAYTPEQDTFWDRFWKSFANNGNGGLTITY